MNSDQLEFLAKLPLLAEEAMRLNLPITARAISNAVKAVGWEASGDTRRAAMFAPSLEFTGANGRLGGET